MNFIFEKCFSFFKTIFKKSLIYMVFVVIVYNFSLCAKIKFLEKWNFGLPFYLIIVLKFMKIIIIIFCIIYH